MTGREELQRLASIVENNRKKLEDLENRKQKIVEILDEHDQTISILRQLNESETRAAKINIGCGVSLPYSGKSKDVKAFVDLGSGIFGEQDMDSTLQITQQRKESVLEVDKMLDQQIDQISEIIQTAAMEFNKAAEALKSSVTSVQEATPSTEPKQEEEKPAEVKRISRRRRGTELTLDD